VLGHVLYPLNTSDFSFFLLQAQSSKARIVALANAGQDTVNSIKQAAEFGIGAGGQRLAALQLTAAAVQGLGLEAAQGLVLTELSDGFFYARSRRRAASNLGIWSPEPLWWNIVRPEFDRRSMRRALCRCVPCNAIAPVGSFAKL
jgi:hypothetical protein